jgi:hypothetical protein
LAFVHARALWDTGDEIEARTRAARALAHFEDDPRPVVAPTRETIRAWIAKHDHGGAAPDGP